MKVKITADGVLAIIQGIFDDPEINVTIDDPSSGWDGKTVKEALNIDYFSFKHRPVSTADIIAKKIKEGLAVNKLAALDRSFCIFSITEIDRQFAKDADVVAIEANMEFWIQSEKIKLLEWLIEDSAVSVNGIRVPVSIGGQTRQAVIVFESIEVIDVQTESLIGETITCSVNVGIMLYPDIFSYSDYEVTFDWDDNGASKSVAMPITSITYGNTMVQKGVPLMNAQRKTGNINLSCADFFTLVFDGYKNDFVKYIKKKTLTFDDTTDNNQAFTMTIKQDADITEHEVIIKDHKVDTNADTGNETHTLSLVTRGLR